MKLEKKHWIIIGVVVAIIVIWYLFFKKKKAESNYSLPTGGGGWKTCRGGKIVRFYEPCPPVNSSRISCPRGQVYNDKTGKCEGKSWGTGPTNPNVMASGTSISCAPPNVMVKGQCMPPVGGIVAHVVGKTGVGHGNKCYCGKDANGNEVWNYTCCGFGSTN